jgi:hypothetical protein
MAMVAAQEDESVVGSGCDDQIELALGLLLAGFERRYQQGWTSTSQAAGKDRP